MILLRDDSWMLPCMSKKYLGMDCPGCGIQRSISHLIHGEYVEAFLIYPAIYPAIFLVGFLIFDYFKFTKHGETIKLWATFITTGTVICSFLIKTFL